MSVCNGAMKNLMLAVVGTIVLAAPAFAAGIDSRVYTCSDLHRLIAESGFVFISQPAFGDFVVSSPYYCGGGDIVELRSVPTLYHPECPVNYCVPQYNVDGGGGRD
jgi:hypothetical protein